MARRKRRTAKGNIMAGISLEIAALAAMFLLAQPTWIARGFETIEAFSPSRVGDSQRQASESTDSYGPDVSERISDLNSVVRPPAGPVYAPILPAAEPPLVPFKVADATAGQPRSRPEFWPAEAVLPRFSTLAPRRNRSADIRF